MLGRLDDCGQVFESVTEARSLAGCGLQGDFNRTRFRGGECFVETFHCRPQIALGAGMQDNKRHPEKSGAIDFIHEGDNGFSAKLRVE